MCQQPASCVLRCLPPTAAVRALPLQAWQDVKSKVPGTTEHKATNPTVM